MGSRVYKHFALIGIVSFALLHSVLSNLEADDGADNTAGTPVDTMGELTVMRACDFEYGRSELIHLLRDFKTDKTARLRFKRGAPTRLHSGAIVRVRGEKVAEEIVVPANGSGSVQTVAEAPLVSGDQHTVVLLINFLDANIECSTASVADLMFAGTNSVDGLYQEMSYGNASFSGDVFGPFTINYTSASGCNYNGWASAAEAAAQAAGVNLSAYSHKVYVFSEEQPVRLGGTRHHWRQPEPRVGRLLRRGRCVCTRTRSQHHDASRLDRHQQR